MSIIGIYGFYRKEKKKKGVEKGKLKKVWLVSR